MWPLSIGINMQKQDLPLFCCCFSKARKLINVVQRLKSRSNDWQSQSSWLQTLPFLTMFLDTTHLKALGSLYAAILWEHPLENTKLNEYLTILWPKAVYKVEPFKCVYKILKTSIVKVLLNENVSFLFFLVTVHFCLHCSSN